MGKQTLTNCAGEEGQADLEALKAEADRLNKLPDNTGIFHTPGPPCVVTKYNAAPNELVYANGNSWIVLGTDRPTTEASGYGAAGSTKASTIDLVVGRMSSARKGKGPKANTTVENSMSGDAARIYISQLTDIDKNFGLAKGDRPFSKGRSGIAVKADAVRIIGRESVKIVTGKMPGVKGVGMGGEPNSLGGKVSQPSPTIELIAGNRDNSEEGFLPNLRKSSKENILQPVAKGENTRLALEELVSIVGSLIDDVRQFNSRQLRINSYISSGLYMASTPYTMGVASAWSSLVANANIQMAYKTMMPLWSTNLKTVTFRVNYLQPFGTHYICSENVKTT